MDANYSDTFQTYDTVGSGTYVCIQCGGENEKGVVTLKNNEMLPECKCCGYTTWIKLK